MIQNYGYHPLNEEPYGIFREGTDLFVSCAGYDEFHHEPFNQSRPKGRKDYYFLYVVEGYLLIHLDEMITVKKGECIILPPNTPHTIQYPKLEHVKVYWMHFSGEEAQIYYEQSVHNQSFPHSCIYIFQEIIEELQYQDVDFEKMTKQLFIRLFVALKRQTKASKKDPLIQDLIHYMHTQMKHIDSIDQMASFINLSPSRLSHRFHEVMNISPMSYLIQLRMERAHRLLLSTHLTVKEIADQIGYNNSLYFSSQFKKYFKISPSEHRKQHLV